MSGSAGSVAVSVACSVAAAFAGVGSSVVVVGSSSSFLAAQWFVAVVVSGRAPLTGSVTLLWVCSEWLPVHWGPYEKTLG